MSCGFGIGTVSEAASLRGFDSEVCDASPLSTSWHSSMHSLQMHTPGPAIMRSTSS